MEDAKTSRSGWVKTSANSAKYIAISLVSCSGLLFASEIAIGADGLFLALFFLLLVGMVSVALVICAVVVGWSKKSRAAFDFIVFPLVLAGFLIFLGPLWQAMNPAADYVYLKLKKPRPVDVVIA